MQKIKFIAETQDTYDRVDIPEPAVSNIPNWYKKANKFRFSNSPKFNEEGYPQHTVKSCIPVFDAMTSGYIQKTWTDIYIEEDSGDLSYRWASGPSIMGHREPWHGQNIPIPPGYNEQIFTWARPWAIQTPRGYSAMFVHPMYHYDLPFVCYPGIIDTDTYNFPGLNSVPFFIKKGFTGLIPSGTPMYQIIPFKVESWKSEKRFLEDQNLILKSKYKIESKFYDGYKKLFWNKKTYQ
jgi:hypothetical protein